MQKNRIRMPGNYIRLFGTHDQFADARSKKKYYEPWLTYTVEDENVAYDKTKEEEKLEVQLAFTMLESGTFKFSGSTSSNRVSYSLDDGLTWTLLEHNTESPVFSGGTKVLLKGKTIPQPFKGIGTFFSTGRFNVEGNVMSLLFDYDAARRNDLTNNEFAFYGLFSGNTSIVDASRMMLPATTLSHRCYGLMFQGCTSLTSAPSALPATDLTNAIYAYNAMFRDCTSLVNPPEISATTLSDSCFLYMFQNCSSLRDAPDLPAETLASGCYYEMFGGCISLTGAPNIAAITLASASCYNMFNGCTALTVAPVLPATTLAERCCYGMFSGCTSLTTPPLLLPATTLADYCYQYMFCGCSSLATLPVLPATSLALYCYGGMFTDCTSLTGIPSDYLPATTLAGSCYSSMFHGCTGLTQTPLLPATIMTGSCYSTMFRNCTSLATAPELPATTLAGSCYSSMFLGCSSLTTPPELPAGTLAENCYTNMFGNCTSLVSAPRLSATTLATSCYFNMFYGCTSLSDVPSDYLPVTTLDAGCYQGMFQGCSSLVIAPDLPAKDLISSCYRNMFTNCTNLNYIKCLATGLTGLNSTVSWVSGVSANGTFVKDSSVTGWTIGNNGIPAGWTVQNFGFGLDTYSAFAHESGDTLQITVTSSYNSWTATTSDNWITLNQNTGSTGNTNVTVTVASTSPPREGSIFFTDGSQNAVLTIKQNDNLFMPLTFEIKTGGTIYWKMYGYPTSATIQYKLNGGAMTSLAPGNSISVSAGNTVELFGTADRYGSSYSSYHTFSGSTATFDVKGNIMSLIDKDNYMELETLTMGYTFCGLFNYAKVKSAENLQLPATTLSGYCYYGMFSGCTALTTAPLTLPATTLKSNCYYGMFGGCTSLTGAPTIQATVAASGSCTNMFSNCFSLTTAPSLPATTLAISCYQGMFQNCTALTTAQSILPATTLENKCYFNMFYACTSLVTAPELPAPTLTEYCYKNMFSGCTSLNYIKCLATNKRATECTYYWTRGVASTGTFVKDASMSSWPNGVDGIPNGWTVEDA